MDNDTTIEDLKKEVKSFCDVRDWDQYHPPKDLAIGMVTEASELLDNFRFRSEEEISEMFRDDVKREDISDELSDTLFFILRFAQMYNIDLSESLKRKMKKNNNKYPVEKSKGSNKKYTEL